MDTISLFKPPFHQKNTIITKKVLEMKMYLGFVLVYKSAVMSSIEKVHKTIVLLSQLIYLLYMCPLFVIIVET